MRIRPNSVVGIENLGIDLTNTASKVLAVANLLDKVEYVADNGSALHTSIIDNANLAQQAALDAETAKSAADLTLLQITEIANTVLEQGIISSDAPTGYNKLNFVEGSVLVPVTPPSLVFDNGTLTWQDGSINNPTSYNITNSVKSELTENLSDGDLIIYSQENGALGSVTIQTSGKIYTAFDYENDLLVLSSMSNAPEVYGAMGQSHMQRVANQILAAQTLEQIHKIGSTFGLTIGNKVGSNPDRWDLLFAGVPTPSRGRAFIWSGDLDNGAYRWVTPLELVNNGNDINSIYIGFAVSRAERTGKDIYIIPEAKGGRPGEAFLKPEQDPRDPTDTFETDPRNPLGVIETVSSVDVNTQIFTLSEPHSRGNVNETVSLYLKADTAPNGIAGNAAYSFLILSDTELQLVGETITSTGVNVTLSTDRPNYAEYEAPGKLWTSFVDKVNAALAAVPQYKDRNGQLVNVTKLTGVLWHQAEANASANLSSYSISTTGGVATYEEYQKVLMQVFDNLRAAPFGHANLPIVVGQAKTVLRESTGTYQGSERNDVLSRITQWDHGPSSCVGTEGLETVDGTHMAATAILGTRYDDHMALLINDEAEPISQSKTVQPMDWFLRKMLRSDGSIGASAYVMPKVRGETIELKYEDSWFTTIISDNGHIVLPKLGPGGRDGGAVVIVNVVNSPATSPDNPVTGTKVTTVSSGSDREFIEDIRSTSRYLSNDNFVISTRGTYAFIYDGDVRWSLFSVVEENTSDPAQLATVIAAVEASSRSNNSLGLVLNNVSHPTGTTVTLTADDIKGSMHLFAANKVNLPPMTSATAGWFFFRQRAVTSQNPQDNSSNTYLVPAGSNKISSMFDGSDVMSQLNVSGHAAGIVVWDGFRWAVLAKTKNPRSVSITINAALWNGTDSIVISKGANNLDEILTMQLFDTGSEADAYLPTPFTGMRVRDAGSSILLNRDPATFTSTYVLKILTQ